MVEDRVVLVDGEDEETALGRAVEIAAEYEDDFETEAGDTGHRSASRASWPSRSSTIRRRPAPRSGTSSWPPGRRRDRCRRTEPLPPSTPDGDGLSSRPRRLSRWRALAPTARRGRSSSRSSRSDPSPDPRRPAHAPARTPRARRLPAWPPASRHDAAPPGRAPGPAFRNRVGLGAGFDKDAVAFAGWAALGSGSSRSAR